MSLFHNLATNKIYKEGSMKRGLFLVLLPIILVSCGDGGGDSLPPMNSSGYPEVGGRYNFLYKDAFVNCGGIKETVPSSSNNIKIWQEGNVLKMESESSSGTPGIAVIEETETRGHIQKNGNFNMTYNAIVRQDNMGIVDVQEMWQGKFNASGCSGIVHVLYIYRSYGVSCNWDPSFECTRL
ncbi:MAG: hypothetical protein OEZ32_13735 [Nitrospinota bacterium]|nr:hypothetical protein [Nitrospinota bacterium]